MKSTYYKLLSILSTVLMFVAILDIKPASFGYLYQPKAPKCLAEKK